FKKILKIDPSRTEYLQTIAHNYQTMGQFDLASQYYELYLETHPDDAGAYHAFGQFFEIQGNYQRGRELYEKALIIEPQNISVRVDVADIEGKLGEDDNALAKYDQALALARTSQDKIRVHESMKNFFSSRGQMTKAIEQLQIVWEEQEKSAPPVTAQIMKLEDLFLFAQGGRGQEAFAIIEKIARDLYPPLDGLINIGYLGIYNAMEDAEHASKALADLKSAIDTYQWETLRDEAWVGEGEIEENRGSYEAAIRCYEEYLKLDPTNQVMHRSIGRCFRQLKQNDKAVSSLGKMLKVYPNDPKTHYELALVYDDMSKPVKAMEHLKKALDWWSKADMGFAPAKRARATLADWES
ncbi:MAG: tetratricopeptide repeat protein, partial [Candidatus Latescibacterota bacterium]